MDLNVLIIGGGIHGVGLLHDLASRRIPGVHLVEKNQIASGTSSRSTKLVHGGIRYLEHISQWGLVYDALRERTLLLKLLPDLVRPMPFVFPLFKSDKRPAWFVHIGISLYDLLAGDGGLPRSHRIKKEDILSFAPYLNKSRVNEEMTDAFVYYDAQMIDDVLARLVAEAAVKLGASYEEHAQVESVTPILTGSGGFRVQIRNAEGTYEVTTKHIVNATGAWANQNLMQWGFMPTRVCLLNLGTHLVFKPAVTPADVNNSYATILQEPDGRVVFFIPWWGRWLLGTTESILDGSPDHIRPPAADKAYLLKIAKESFHLDDVEHNLDEVFCGVRCMPLKQKIKAQKLKSAWTEKPFESPFYVKRIDKNISSLSRETVIEESHPGLISIYGGKYTTYRAISEHIGRLLHAKLNLGTQSGTHLKENWFYESILEEKPEIFVSSRSLRQA